MADFFYRTEAKGIQAWILQSDRLRELCGGSNIIVKLDKEIQELAGQCHAKECFAAAGGATMLFDRAENLQAFANHWPFFVSQRAPGLQIVQAWAENMRDVYPKLGDARNVLTPDLPVAGPLANRSGRTGLPAVRIGEKDGLEDRIVREKLASFKRDGDSLR